MSTPSSDRSSAPAAPDAQASARAISAASPAARARRTTKPALALLLLALTVFPGCYLSHLAAGQLRLLHAARPIDRVVADPETPPAIRDALGLVAPTLAFARGLGLDVGRQYRSYAAWPGDRVVTAVVATRPGSVEPAGFWFPIVGRVPYESFFARDRARREADHLRAKGLDVCEVAVPAYSTLGWFADPVTGPLVRSGPGFLVETLIHELVHATVFVPGDADFDEGVATFIGQEGAVRFFDDPLCPKGASGATRPRCGTAAAHAERLRVRDERAVARVLSSLRGRIAALYRDAPAGAERVARRAALVADARAELAALPLATRPAVEVAESARLDDACLALAGTYESDLDIYAARLDTLGGDLAAFVAEVRRAARKPHPRAALGVPLPEDPSAARAPGAPAASGQSGPSPRATRP
jgi:predicted aminopeptidase